MSEPLTREERLNAKRELNHIAQVRPWSVLEDWHARALNDLEALEKQHAADLEAQQAAMLKCIREERVSKQAERDTLRAQNDQYVENNAAMIGDLGNMQEENAELRARCEQLQQEADDAVPRQEYLESLKVCLRCLGRYQDEPEFWHGEGALVCVQCARNAELEARVKQLEQLYSHKDLDFECAESGCKSKRLTARCEQLESALQLHVDHFGDPLKVAIKALEK